MKKEMLQWRRLFILGMALLVIACEEVIPEAPAENELLDGPMEGLSHAEQAHFLDGNIAFNDEIFTAENEAFLRNFKMNH